MEYQIYKTTNLLDGKFYIGKHACKCKNCSYMGSGKYIKDALKKHGKENFKKEVLFILNSEEEMNAKEKELITEDFVKRDDTYNLGIGGEGGPHFKGKTHSKETMSKILKNRTILISDDGKKRISNAHLGKNLSDEHKQKISNAHLGKNLSDEHKQKISNSLARNIHSIDTKRKMSVSAKNKVKYPCFICEREIAPNGIKSHLNKHATID